MRKVVASIAIVIVGSVLVWAADVFQQYGIDRQEWSSSFLYALTNPSLPLPSVPAKLKSLPVGERAAVVTALGAAARAWIGTAEFQERYKKEYEASLPDDLKPPRTAKQIADEMKSELQSQLAEMEKTAKTMSGDMQKAILEAATALKAQMGQIDQFAAMQAAEEKARYEEAKSRPPDPDAPSADPNVGLKRTLKRFLDGTADVDFDAQLKTQYGLKKFVNADHEAKPKEWKACFRAGKEACGAARDLASAWLAELK